MEAEGKRAHLDALARIITQLPQFHALGLELIEFEPGHCVMALEQRPELIGDPERGILHGGVITTLLDSVAGTAAYSQADEGVALATLDLRIDYLRPARAGKRVFGAAEVYRRTRNVYFVSGTAYQDDPDSPVARCAASFMLGSVGFAPKETEGEAPAC